MTNYSSVRSCPICNSKEVSFIKNFKFSLFDKHPMLEGYNVVQCANCGFVYADTKVTQSDLDVYYKDLSKYEDKTIGTGGGFTEHDKNRLLNVAKFINENIQDKSIRIADIGCANGGLLKELKELGFTNLVGIDPSSTCIDITKSEVGCEVYQYSIFDIEPEVGKFGLIILSHVLEHILEVDATMEKLDELLDTDGYIYVECPNAQNYSKIIHAPYQEFNTEHINHFDEVAFANLFGTYGYKKIFNGNKTLKIASNDDYHAVYGLFKKGENKNYLITYDDNILENINDYVHKSELIYNSIINQIKNIGDEKTIALFGIGQFSFKILANSVLKSKTNLLLFDNNSLNIGKSIDGLDIHAGKDIANILGGKNAVIVITSLIHEADIRESLLRNFEKQNVVVPAILGFKRLLNNLTSIPD